MSPSQSEWQSDIYAIWPHPTRVAILMLPDRPDTSTASRWSLPYVTLSRRLWFLHLGWVTGAMRTQYDADVTALRYLSLETDEARQHVTGVFVLENHRSDPTPPANGAWFSYDALQNLPLQTPEHRSDIEDYFAEIRSDQVPKQRPSWARPGWYDRVTQWITDEVEAMDLTLTAPIQQVRVWGLSCVLRVQTNRQDFYFKCGANLPLAANEPLLMTFLGREFPDFVPAPVCIQAEKGWMLLDDFGDQLAWEAPVQTVADAYESLAEMQIALIAQTDTLLAMGCHDRRMDTLIKHIDWLMAHLPLIQGLEKTEIEQLQKLAPRFKEMCWQLDDLQIPYSLVHGDFYAGNIAIRNDKPYLFDWAEGCIAHPFFDLLDLFEKEGATAPAALKESYLRPWQKIIAPEAVLTGWELAKPLAALHTAISSVHILNALEENAKGQLAWAPLRWLRLLLQFALE